MDLIRAFTGPSRLTEDQVEWVESEIIGLIDEPDEVRTGCADGLDTIAAGLQWSEYPNARHKLFVPSAYHNDKFVKYMSMKENVEVIRCPRKSPTAAAYRSRNSMMVCGYLSAYAIPAQGPATVLEAFVFNSEFYRSGEWMTINLAGNCGVLVNKHVIPA